MLACADCPRQHALPAACAVELLEVWWIGGRKPELWRPVCDDRLADYRMNTRVIDFAGA